MDSQCAMKIKPKGSRNSQADRNKAIAGKTTTRTVGRPALECRLSSLHAHEMICCNLAALDLFMVLSIIHCSSVVARIFAKKGKKIIACAKF